jgi:predicted ribosomally synthesized peptide with nif11-like leader
MSLEQAKAFLERVDEDESLRASVKAAYAQDLLRIANENGFEVSVDDLNAAVAELSDFGDELSISQLEGVAGGGFGFSSARIAVDPAH